MEELGKQVKFHRKRLKMSLRTLADQSGVTATYLSKIERGMSNPSVDIIRRIAQALHVSIFNLLQEGKEKNRVVRKAARLKINPPHTQITYELLTPDLKGNIEMFLVEVESTNIELGKPTIFPTEECIFVLRGKMTLQINQEIYTLEEGDSIRFDGQNLNSLKSASKEKLVFISAVTPPIF